MTVLGSRVRAVAIGRTSAPHPALRGISHQYAAPLAALIYALVVLRAPSRHAELAAMILAVGITAMLTSSAVFHRVPWSVGARPWARRVDHCMIYVAMTSMYASLWLIALPHTLITDAVLAAAVTMTVLGVVFKLTWIDAPRAVSSASYLLFGCTGFVALPALVAAAPTSVVELMLAGAALEAVGAVIFAIGRPDPWPDTFGFHEIFHLCTLVGVGLQSAAVVTLVLR